MEPYVTLEALLRPSIRDAVHEKVWGVPDVPLSETSDPSCVRDDPTTRAESTQDVYRTLSVYPAGSSAAEIMGLRYTDRYNASGVDRRCQPTCASAGSAGRLLGEH